MGPKKIGAMGRNFALDFVAWSMELQVPINSRDF